MDTAVLVGLVMTIVQVLKKWPLINKIPPIALTVVISFIVVVYKALETGGTQAFTIDLLIKLILVIISANGAYKLIKVSSGE